MPATERDQLIRPALRGELTQETGTSVIDRRTRGQSQRAVGLHSDDTMLLILDLHSIHGQAQAGIGVPHVRLTNHPAPQGDLALVSVGGDMTGIVEVG